MLSIDEIKDYLKYMTVRDLRTLSTMLVDMMSDKQINTIGAFFEKKTSITFNPELLKKEPQIAQKGANIEPELDINIDFDSIEAQENQKPMTKEEIDALIDNDETPEV